MLYSVIMQYIVELMSYTDQTVGGEGGGCCFVGGRVLGVIRQWLSPVLFCGNVNCLQLEAVNYNTVLVWWSMPGL